MPSSQSLLSQKNCPTKIEAMNHHPKLVQATNIWGTVKEKVVEGKESAAEKVILLREATVEKVNSMKENVDGAITFESDSPVKR